MNLKEMFSMARHAAGLQKNAKKIESQLKSRIVEASSPDGKVTAAARGDGKIIKITIAPEMLRPGETAALEKSVLAAVQSAGEKAKETAQEAVRQMAAEMGLPGDMLDKLL